MNDESDLAIAAEPVSDGAPRDIHERTKAFAVRIVKLSQALPRSREADVVGRQVLRCGTSVGAHCREAYRARSTAEFISKVHGALMELEESLYWLELLAESGIVPRRRLESLCSEADQLLAVLTASVETAKSRRE